MENTLDIKDIKGIVEEGLQVTQKNWDSKRAEDQKAFDEKVNSVLKGIEEKGYTSKTEVEKHVKEMQDQFDELATKMNKKDLSGTKKVSFKQAIADALKENHNDLKNVQEIKGSKIIQLKDITYDGNFPGFDDYRQELRSDMITQDRDVFHLRDIISVGATSKDTIKYPREGVKTGTGPDTWERGADIASTTSKPEFEPNLDTYSTEVKWIAGIMRLPVEMLADLPFLTSYLQRFAQVELLETEDDQLLNGNGVGKNLDGLMNNATTYNGTYSNMLEILVDAAYGQLAQNNLTASHVLLNPRDVVSIILNKASGSGEYDLPGGSVGFVNGQLQVAGLNVRKTNKIAVDNYLLGDFRQAQIFQRQAPQLRFFEQDKDNVELNLITARIEERIALAILKTHAFVKGTFTAEV